MILNDVGARSGSADLVNTSGCSGILIFPAASLTCPCHAKKHVSAMRHIELAGSSLYAMQAAS